MNRIIVLGSLNFDTTLAIEHFPKMGETTFAVGKERSLGGKGGNQAVAAARSKAEVVFLGKVGDDEHGKTILEALKKEKIDIAGISVTKELKTGAAYILLNKSGQNSIIVYGGANEDLKLNDFLSLVKRFNSYDFIVSQFEIPKDTVKETFSLARKQGVVTVLNPAPAQKIDEDLANLTDLLIPNEVESEMLTGIKITDLDSMEKSGKTFLKMGFKNVIITIGSRGVYYLTEKFEGFQSAYKVNAVDTSAAGDTFIGALLSQLNPDFNNLVEAISFAQCASSITVQRHGTQKSIPTIEEIKETLKTYEVRR